MTQAKNLLKGGVNPPDDSCVSRTPGIANAIVPSRAVIPLLQHAGSPARCLVKPGDAVREGMLIGRAEGSRSVNVHASIPGNVAEVREMTLPDGVACEAVVIELGGEFETSGKLRPRISWESLSRRDLLDSISTAGVVGLSGGAIPTPLKLAVSPDTTVSLLVANGIESEPSLSANYALLREKPAEIAEALRICRVLLSPERIVLALGEDAEGLAPGLDQAFNDARLACQIAFLPTRYPQGHEQLVLCSLNGTGPAAVPAMVLSVATLYAIYEAVALNKPFIDRVLTVTGASVARPRNLKVRMGTRIGDLFEECGGLLSDPGKIVVGGPMRGIAVDSLDTPVTKGTSAVVAFTRADARPRREWPCVRCGTCIEVCPWGLVPTRLYKLIHMGDVAAADREGLARCSECGCCAYACPSHIPLASVFKSGKRALNRSTDG
ncbi:MAG: RnfABCDGE type electron transport complex subunit C [Spirochaetia bacterium]|jgi:electron transport complex protein RnfC